MSKIQKGEFPYGHFFKMISGKWKPYILVAIDYEGCIRFNSILKFWGEISSKVLYQNLREEFADISRCVDCIIEYLNQKLDCEVTEEEKMYLILHVNRICSKEKCAEETEDGKGNR